MTAAGETSATGGGREQRFADLYHRFHRDITAYALRRVPLDGHGAADIAAEVFAIAWRRLDVVPEAPEDRLWLYGVARRVVARHRRRARRRGQLMVRLRHEQRTRVPASPSSERLEALRAAIGRLGAKDREAIRLVLWDGLRHDEAATVLGCTPNALGVRLHRARRRLAAALGESAPLPVSGRPQPPDHDPLIVPPST